jgi:protein O-GlcNAc transferase
MASDAEATFAAALAHHEAGQLDAARAGYNAALAEDPCHLESLHLLGLIMAQEGEAEIGAVLIERAMRLAPGRAPHHNSLAFAYRGLGRDADAMREYRTALTLRPGSAQIRNNLATTLKELGLHQEAIVEYRLAAGYAPETAEIWYNLANCLVDHGAVEEVEACFRLAIELRPNFVDALANYGRWLIARARWAEAESWLSEAVRLLPNNPLNCNNLGVARHELGRIVEAEANFLHAIALDPNFADAHYNLGCLLSGDGRTDEAVSRHEAAIAADRLHGAARLAFCTARLPILYRNETEVAERRRHYLAGLNELVTAVKMPAVARAVATAIGTSQPFFLPYQGENDCEPQTTYGRLACGLLAEAEKPTRLAPAPRTGERIRLGIVSGYFRDHTISRLFLQGWLTELDRDRFEVIGFHTGHTCDAETTRLAKLCDRFFGDVFSAAAWREVVTDVAPHALLYPEIGIDPICGQLAAQRLAPVQCVAWGHPETTGMPTMDYFLSADTMEPPDGQTHYTERLVRMPGLGLHYTPEKPAAQTLDRAAFGMDPGIPAFWSGQALYKYLPVSDSVFPRIAAAVGACQFIFIGFAKSPAITSMFRERLRLAFGASGLDADRYCVMLPPMPQQRYLAAAGLADVILDTIGWSGGKSTLDCLAMDPAIVTFPGRFMRGRHTAAILRRIGCGETIAASLDDYVAIAARLGLDARWRTHVSRVVAEGKHRAFRDTAYIRALEIFLMGAVGRS